jgi:hypothetical protein
MALPAHNRLAEAKGDAKTEFEIVPSLNGKPVLFDFIGPADVLDLLVSIELYLGRVGSGRPLRQ